MKMLLLLLFVLLHSRTESVVLKGHTGAVRSVDFSYNAAKLLTGSDDKTLKVIIHQIFTSYLISTSWSGLVIARSQVCVVFSRAQ